MVPTHYCVDALIVHPRINGNLCNFTDAVAHHTQQDQRIVRALAGPNVPRLTDNQPTTVQKLIKTP